jgi:hypothetical protein
VVEKAVEGVRNAEDGTVQAWDACILVAQAT